MKMTSRKLPGNLNSRFAGRGPFTRALAVLLVALLATAALPAETQSAGTEKPATPSAPYKAYGTTSAPIKMDVFADYQCPHCREFYDTTLRQVIQFYVADGKVYLVHHDFPLQMHRHSGEAARWANACANVGQFEAAETASYDNQDSWGADGNIGKFIAAAMPASDFKRVQAIMKGSSMPAPQAQGYSADPMTKVDHPCPVDPYIVQDIELGYRLPVPSTPTFVITYKGHAFQPVSYSVSWPILKEFFDNLLRQ